MDPLAILTLINTILSTVPSALTAYNQIKADVQTNGSSAEVQAMLDQIDANVAKTQGNLKELGIEA